MRTGTFGFFIGCLLLQACPVLPEPRWALLLFPLLWLLAVTRARALWRAPVCCVIGFFWAGIHASSTLDRIVPATLEGRDIVVEGYVATPPTVHTHGVRFDFDVVKADVDDDVDLRLPLHVRLSWYQDTPPLQAGERWRLRVRLKRPRGFMNPGGFDYEGWLYQQGIHATGYVRKATGNTRIAASGWRYAVNHARQSLAYRVREALSGHAHTGILLALVTGLRDGIDAPAWETLTRTGTNHLVAISGLHISLVAGVVFWLARRLWRILPRDRAQARASTMAAWIALAAAAGYALLAGFTTPTRRALLMLAVVFGARLADRELQPANALWLALLAVLLVDPAAPLSAGFWLSFAAVAVILYGIVGRSGKPGLLSAGRLHWRIALGLAPFTLILFQRMSWVSPLANLVAVPWVSVIVVPVALAGALLSGINAAIGSALLTVAASAWGVLWHWLELCGHLPWAEWTRHAPPVWAVVSALAGMGLWFAPRGLPVRCAGIALCLPLLCLPPSRPASGEAWFTLLDVGQGLAAVVRTAAHTLVFDTGPRFSESFDTGAAVVVPFLRESGVTVVDTLVISHGDNDHIGGAQSLFAAMPVAQVLTSTPSRLGLRRSRRCHAGQRWQWDGVDFEMLHPADTADVDLRARGNDGSCVLRVSAPGGSILLPGDIEAAGEAAVIATAGAGLASDVLISPHHGSLTSSTQAFLDTVRPRYILIPAGYRNRYGFPKPQVLARYRALPAVIMDSASDGAITLRIGPGVGVVPTGSWRQAARRYWHAD